MTDDWILFTMDDNSRVVISARAIESIEERSSKKTHVTTRHTTIEVAMTFDEVIGVVTNLVNKQNKRNMRQVRSQKP